MTLVTLKNFSSNESTEEKYSDKFFFNVVIEEEKYYAVIYFEGWYVGRIINKIPSKIQDETAPNSAPNMYLMKFLKQDLGSYIWPKQEDVAKVEDTYIFYGPLQLIGTGVYNLKRTDINNIEKLYRKRKKQ